MYLHVDEKGRGKIITFLPGEHPDSEPGEILAHYDTLTGKLYFYTHDENQKNWIRGLLRQFNWLFIEGK